MKRTKDLTDAKKAELHDHLGLHVPATTDANTFCLKCGSPIMYKDNVFNSATSVDGVMYCINESNLFNKYSVRYLLTTPEGALFVGKYIRKADHVRKAASRKPEIAYRYALKVDECPHNTTRIGAAKDPVWSLMYAQCVDKAASAVTWWGVQNYEMERDAYKKHFSLTNADILQKFNTRRTRTYA